MKSVKKILSLVLVMSLLLALITLPVSAEISSEADTARILGVLKGDGAGVTDEYLAKSTNRSQGAKILLRLMGIEAEADAFSGSVTFSDASDASSYWQNMLSYLKANPEVGFQGYPDGTFKPNKVMTAQEIYKVLLTSLGYEQGVDFEWSEVFTFAAEKGLTALYGTSDITNDDLATALVEALNATKKDGVKLINFLVTEGVVTSNKAAEAGFITIASVDFEDTYFCEIGSTPDWPATLTATYADATTGTVAVTWSSINSSTTGIKAATGTVEGYGTISVNVEVVPETLTVMDAFPSDADEVTVLLNKEVPLGTTIRLKRGVVGITTAIEWATNRKSFKFTQAWNFTAGEYTVFVGDSEKTFVISNETAEAIYINADYIFPMANQDLQVNLVNQYGQAMNITNAHITVSNITQGVTLPYSVTGESVIVNGATADAGDQLMVFVLHNTSMLTATKQISVYAEPTIKALQFGAITIADNKSTIVENTVGHKVEVYAVDQYGNPLMLTNTDINGGAITLISSNNTIIDASSVMINTEGDMVFSAMAAGQCTLTMLLPTEGLVSSQIFTVYALSSVDNLFIGGPTGRVTAGSVVDLIASASDQYGTSIPLLNNFDPAKLSVTSSSNSVVPSAGVAYDAGRGVITMMAGQEGTAILTYSYDNEFMGTFSITVEAASKPYYIASLDIPGAFQIGATKTIDINDITIKDQYNEVMDLDGTSAYTVQIEMVGGTASYLSPNTYSITGSNSVTFTGNAAGTGQVKLTILDNAGPITTSVYQKNIAVVESSDIATYTFASVPVLYGSSMSAGSAYEKTLVINGKTSTGVTVQLAGGAVPAGISVVTSSNDTNFDFDGASLKISANSAGTTVVNAWSNGTVVASLTVTAIATAPVVTTLYFEEPTMTLSNGSGYLASLNLTAKDQYGVDVSSSATFLYFSSNTAVATINQGTGVIATVSTGTTRISIIDSSGTKSAYFDLTVN